MQLQSMEGVKRLEQRPISVAEAKAATEVFLLGSSLPVMPVVQVGFLLVVELRNCLGP